MQAGLLPVLERKGTAPHADAENPAEIADLHLCPLQFVDKEPTLAEPVLSQLLKFWPVINSQKEVLRAGEAQPQGGRAGSATLT